MPYVAQHRAQRARIYGSRTLKHLLAPFPGLAPRVETFEESEAGDGTTPGAWRVVAPDRVRVMPLRSRHSTQLTLAPFLSKQRIPFHLWRGDLTEDLATPPRAASDWAEGAVFAYLIDFLEPGGQVAFRVYFQDSGANFPWGHVPPPLIQQKRVDVALLCVGGDFHRLVQHPESIIANTRPRFALLGHWEDFFVTQDNHAVDGAVFSPPNLAFLKEQDTKTFVERARKALHRVDPTAEAWLPCPTRSVFFIPQLRSSTSP